ncbi:unnamed protein product [Callosobruchus maculatus]|uniref:Uncharacterized protein n=1 Tax=Callosobruchus maculatus TaxID=64391 RepID=A0A653D6X6_CALMS|nr:unnamed protein product [Callosobruchus maculatus]
MLTFFGHCIHRSDNMEKLVVQGHAPSGRRHGHSPTRWVDTTKHLLDMSINSVTKLTIINGHKVVINETEYSKDDDLGGSFFHVRVIDVRPEDEGKSGESSTSKDDASREPLAGQDSKENEIPQNSREVGVPKPEKITKA